MRLLTVAAIAISASAGLVGASLFDIATVRSKSMEPTASPGQHVLFLYERSLSANIVWRNRPNRLKRGDLVVLRRAAENVLVLKRILALGGDNVAIKEGLLFVNDVAVPETYAHHASGRLRISDNWPEGLDHQPIRIPSGMAFVLGDNRSDSADSRLWGPVALSDVVGRVIAVLP